MGSPHRYIQRVRREHAAAGGNGLPRQPRAHSLWGAGLQVNSTARSAAGSPVGYPSQASPPPRSKTGDSSGRFARHVFLSSHSFAVREGVARYFLDCFAGAAAVGTAANTTYGVSITSCPGGNGRRGFRGEGPGVGKASVRVRPQEGGDSRESSGTPLLVVLGVAAVSQGLQVGPILVGQVDAGSLTYGHREGILE